MTEEVRLLPSQSSVHMACYPIKTISILRANKFETIFWYRKELTASTDYVIDELAGISFTLSKLLYVVATEMLSIFQ